MTGTEALLQAPQRCFAFLFQLGVGLCMCSSVYGSKLDVVLCKLVLAG